MTSPITTTPTKARPCRVRTISLTRSRSTPTPPRLLTTIHTPKHNKHFIQFEESQLIKNHALHLIQHRFPLNWYQPRFLGSAFEHSPVPLFEIDMKRIHGDLSNQVPLRATRVVMGRGGGVHASLVIPRAGSGSSRIVWPTRRIRLLVAPSGKDRFMLL
ncbi:hypothetical protein CEXT_368791 [Caerostris extrusa]|uniref:Uncharacterized protein n=1 Tax=Caerostris extrusa TaxID=172846 RepID=A0AAV4Q8X6_CAEEX|nr:hypothetical protein CEXT_368791 [Caerostris extrusa]